MVQVDAVKGICFKQLPKSLCIHLKRFEFDYEQMTRWKIKDRCGLPLQSWRQEPCVITAWALPTHLLTQHEHGAC